jgi:hypothetical protein
VTFLTKAGSFTGPTATGNFSVTGVGFQPKAILLMGGVRSTNFDLGVGTQTTDMPMMFGIGAGTPAASVAFQSWFNDDNFASGDDGSYAGIILTSNGTVVYKGTLVSLDSDGFTLNFTTVPGTGTRFYYLALGGSDLQAEILTAGDFASTGNHSFTGGTFKPDCAIVIGGGITGGNTGQAEGRGFISFVKDTTHRTSMGGGFRNSGTSLTKYERSDLAVACAAGSLGKLEEGDLVSMDSGGLTINFTTYVTGDTAVTHACLSLKGVNFAVGAETQKTSTGTKATTGLGFQPSALIWGSQMMVASSAVSTTGFLGESMGFTDGTAIRCQALADNANANSYQSNSQLVVMIDDSASGGVKALATLSSFDAGGYTLNWGTADATAREFIYLAVGAAGAAAPAAAPAFQPHKMPQGC